MTDAKRLHALFSDMVDIYSPSGKEEELVHYLAEYLDGKGLSVVLRSVDETRYNLEISARRARPDYLFLGHIDTVPAYDIDDYAFSEEEGVCYGLGTADMKGGCAALIEAFVSAEEAGNLPDNVLLSLVVGEEESGDGTSALLDAWQFAGALVAEPTGLLPCTAHYGYLEAIITLYGYRRHAAMSERDTHAVRGMLRLLLQLEEWVEQEGEDSILNIRDLHSSESGFAAPDRCSASVDIHLPPGGSVAAYAKALEAKFQSFLQKTRVTNYEIEMPFLAEGYRLNGEEPFTRMLQSTFHSLSLAWDPGFFKSHSDANLLKDAGCSPVILGPGSLAYAHTRDEQVTFRSVQDAAELYALFLRRISEG
jgi:acetylornithine deacetylase